MPKLTQGIPHSQLLRIVDLQDDGKQALLDWNRDPLLDRQKTRSGMVSLSINNEPFNAIFKQYCTRHHKENMRFDNEDDLKLFISESIVQKMKLDADTAQRAVLHIIHTLHQLGLLKSTYKATFEQLFLRGFKVNEHDVDINIKLSAKGIYVQEDVRCISGCLMEKELKEIKAAEEGCPLVDSQATYYLHLADEKPKVGLVKGSHAISINSQVVKQCLIQGEKTMAPLDTTQKKDAEGEEVEHIQPKSLDYDCHFEYAKSRLLRTLRLQRVRFVFAAAFSTIGDARQSIKALEAKAKKVKCTDLINQVKKLNTMQDLDNFTPKLAGGLLAQAAGNSSQTPSRFAKAIMRWEKHYDKAQEQYQESNIEPAASQYTQAI